MCGIVVSWHDTLRNTSLWQDVVSVFTFNQDSVSERLRRWTRNPLGSARRGSNPLAVDKSQLRCHRWHFLAQRISRLQKSMLSCGASKHHRSRAPAFRNSVVDCWGNHARVVTPVGSL